MTTFNDFSSCIARYDPHALPVSAAQAIVRQWASPVAAVERVPLHDALDRVLAADVVSPVNVPAHDNSAMDGYAFDGASLATAGTPTIDLHVAGKALAGHPFERAIAAGECVRVMTGALMPPGCDTVVPQAQVTRDGATIHLPPGAFERGATPRLVGADLA